jgi:hypothetical protein
MKECRSFAYAALLCNLAMAAWLAVTSSRAFGIVITGATCSTNASCSSCKNGAYNVGGVDQCFSTRCNAGGTTFKTCVWAGGTDNCNQGGGTTSVQCTGCLDTFCSNVQQGNCGGCTCPMTGGTLNWSNWPNCF